MIRDLSNVNQLVEKTHRGSSLTCGFSEYGMDEIDSPKCTSNQGIHTFAANVDLGCRPDMREYIVKAKFSQRQLDVVCMGAKILHAMQSLPHAPQCFKEVFFLATSGSARIAPPKVDGSRETVLDVSSARCPAAGLICKVVFKASLWIDGAFNGLDGRSEARIILLGVVWISHGVVEVFFGAIAAQALLSDFELAGCISERHEALSFESAQML
jgi:hypothetical protein